MYAISMVMIYELVPPSKYPLYTAAAIGLVALANAVGPVFGGLITERSTWRWVFLLKYTFCSARFSAIYLQAVY